ncbi:MAG: mannonate dehydratase [Anaerolineae bacterium]|nr:TIM barrel protein [Chloroflexota bacterium]
MYLGAQLPYSDDDLAFARQMGVTHVDVSPLDQLGLERGYWGVEALLRVREKVEQHGLILAAMHLPLTSAGIERQIWPDIMLGGPDRDRQIEYAARCVEAAGQAGITTLLYNLAILPVVRNPQRAPGRGGVTYSQFRYHDLSNSPHPNAPVSAEQAWERIAYFIERIIPVAEASGVRLGCHQHDPGMPEGVGYRGIERVLGSIEGVKQFIALSDSPFHGLNFCQGTISEMCTDPEQVYEAIRYFGGLGRIFWVHFRNIRGGFLDFCEVYPDEGDIDMVRAIRAYREAGYDGVLIPDHVPHSELDTPYNHRSHAFSYGYIRGLIDATEVMS